MMSLTRKAVSLMGEIRTVRKRTAFGMEQARQLSREQYKSIKHMDKVELADYLGRVFRRGHEAGYDVGYKAGYEAAIQQAAAQVATDEAAQATETQGEG